MKNLLKIGLATAMLICLYASPVPAQEVKKSDTLVVKTSAICGQCKERIEQGMAFEKGVKKTTLNDETKKVTVIYNPSKTSPDAIRTAISKLGYDADEVVAEPKAYEKLPPCCKKDQAPH
jgi:cation transport ATPase